MPTRCVNVPAFATEDLRIMFRVLQRNRDPGYSDDQFGYTSETMDSRPGARPRRVRPSLIRGHTTRSPPPIRKDWIALTNAIVLRHGVDLVWGHPPLWL